MRMFISVLWMALFTFILGSPAYVLAQSSDATLDVEFRSLEQFHRQLNLIGPLRRHQVEAFNLAEAFHRKGLRAYRKGDLASAKRNASLAATAYRDAVLDALSEEPIQQAQKALRKEYPKVDKKRVAMAQRHIDEAKAIIHGARGRDFEIAGVTDAVFNVLSTAMDLINPATEVVADPLVCTETVEPGVSEFVVRAPAPGSLLNHAPIYYLEGDTLQLSLLLSKCTFVGEISLVLFDGPGGIIQLDTEATGYDPIEGTSGSPYYYEIVSDFPEEDSSRHRVTLNLHFPDHDDGRSIAVGLLIYKRPGGPAFSGQREFTVSLVKTVGGEGRWGLAENEIRNDFVSAIYQEFGDDGRSNQGRLYDPSYRSLLVKIEEDGIHFMWRVKAEIENFCDPTIKIDGRFEIVPQGAMLDVVWADDGPDVDIDFAIHCDVALSLLGPVVGIAQAIARNNARQDVRNRIATQVAAIAGALNEDVFTFLNRVDMMPGELQVVFNLPIDHVTIDVPYGQLRLQEPANFGLALNPDERVFALASGLASVCGTDGRPLPNCDTATNPSGNFNWNTNNPIPSPWFVTDTGLVGYLKQRHNAWKELVGLRRAAERLPFVNENVGMLVGRLENAAGRSQHLLLADACAITARAGAEDRLAFGPNDYRFKGLRDNGTDTWQVTVHWPPPIAEIPACRQATLPLMVDFGDPPSVFQ